jgi:alginate O-acetyltransferase complex protein AlgJ
VAPLEVLEGREGFLFMRGDANRVLDQHTGALTPGREWSDSWQRLLGRRDRRLGDAGIPWYGLVAPDKEAVYPEMLPEGIEPAPRRPIHAFLEAAAGAGAPVGYPVDALRRAKRDGVTYSLTDTHWNARGAYIACGEIADGLAGVGVGIEPPDPERIEWRRLNVPGDLGSKLTPPREGRTIVGRLREPRAELRSDNLIANHGRLITFVRPDAPSLPRAVLFGESYSYHLLPFLSEAFSRLSFAHSSAFDHTFVHRERADVVLWSPVERFLLTVPDDRLAGARLRAHRMRKRLRGRRAEPGGHFLAGPWESPAVEAR